MDRLLKIAQGLGIKAELRHIQLKVRLVQEAHDDLFSEESREHRDSNIQFLPGAHLQLDPPILGESPLSDIELGHYFEPREQRVLELGGGIHDLVQHPIDTKAYAKNLFVWLDMNIARPPFGRIGQNGID